MEGQQYLDQITELNRPVKAGGGKGKSGLSGILSSKFFIIGAIGVGLLILIVVIGSLLGGGKTSEKDLLVELMLHIDGTTEVIQEYQADVKSSDLRSSAASLQGILSNTSKDLADYIEQKYNLKEKDIPKATQEEATLATDELSNELFEAKINGILDRIFAHKMAYEITLITTDEAKLIKSTSNDGLKDLLDTSYSSLDTLYAKFNDYSETK